MGESYWTATTVTGKNMDSAGSEAFMRLFRYISGDNERNEKIEMTVPVLASVVPGQGAFPRAEGGQGPVRRRDVLHGGVRLPFQAHRQAQRGLGQARVHRLSPL